MPAVHVEKCASIFKDELSLFAGSVFVNGDKANDMMRDESTCPVKKASLDIFAS